MSLFPAFLKLQDRLVVIIGGGAIATEKIPALLQAGARVRLISPKITPKISDWVRANQLEWRPKRFDGDDLNGAFLVIAATSLRDLNESVFRSADARNILCNAVDDIDHCHFYYGSIVQRGDLQIAISTNGKSPALAQRLRKELEAQFPHEYAQWLEWLGSAREALRSQPNDPDSVKRLLHGLASRPEFEKFLAHASATIADTNSQGASLLMSAPNSLRSSGSLPARVFLIGAGPGDPDLLTIKALRLLQQADAVLHDSLVSPEILDLIPQTTERIDVGKRAGQKFLTQQDINGLLIAAAQKQHLVVRLKGGDPLLFGRAAEEIQALREARIDFEIVPGISAAFASAASAKFSLTDRRLASHVLFTTFSRSPEAQLLPTIGLTPETTVAVYMPGPDYSEVSRWLINSGFAPETPCLVVSKVSTPDEQQHQATLATLPQAEKLPAPALLLVGRVIPQYHTDSGVTDWFPHVDAAIPNVGVAF